MEPDWSRMTDEPQIDQENSELEPTRGKSQEPPAPSRLTLAIARNLPLGCSLLVNLLLTLCMCLTLAWVAGFVVSPAIFKARPTTAGLAQAQTKASSSRIRFTSTPEETTSADATATESVGDTPTSEAATPAATLEPGAIPTGNATLETGTTSQPSTTQAAQTTPRPINQSYKVGDLTSIMLTQDTLTSLTQPKQWDPVLVDENVLENWSTDDNFNTVISGWLQENLYNSFVQTNNRCDPPFCQVVYGGLIFDTPEHAQQAYSLWMSNLSKTLQTPIKNALVSQDYIGSVIQGYDSNNDVSACDYTGLRGNLMLFVSVSYQGQTAPAAIRPSSLALFTTMISQAKTVP